MRFIAWKYLKHSACNVRNRSSEKLLQPEYSIVAATLSDLSAIDRCNRESLPENYEPYFIANYIRRWPNLVLLAKDKTGSTLGYALGRVGDVNDVNYQHSETGFLTSIAVHPDSRNFGVGYALMNSMHFFMKQDYNLKSLSLHVRESNEGAIRFYKSMNYVEVSTMYHYYVNHENALLLTKFLS